LKMGELEVPGWVEHQHLLDPASRAIFVLRITSALERMIIFKYRWKINGRLGGLSGDMGGA